jgi:hypothetical protein
MREKKFVNVVNSFSYSSDKEAIMREFTVIAAREGKKKSELITEIIEEYVKNHSEGNNTFKLDNWQQDPEFKATPALLSDREKWNNYIDECSDNDCTEIAIMANHISRVVQMRRAKEFKDSKSIIK